MGEKGGSIPYQRIEYLMATKTQYISLPLEVSVGDFLQIELEFQMTYATTAGLFGYASQFQASRFNDTILSSNIGGKATNGGIDFAVNQRGSILLSTEGKKGFDGVYIELQRPIKSGFSSVGIFRAIGSTTSTNYFYVYSCKWTHNDALVYDLIPVRIGSVGYMYDTVSGELFGNAGTGDFVLGPDINE